MDIDYIKQVEGNEAVLDKYVEAVFDGTCKASKIYPSPYQLPGYENCWNKPLIQYFMQQKPFVLERVMEFFEKLRKIDEYGFKGFDYELDLWVEDNIQKPFFNKIKINFYTDEFNIKPEIDVAGINPDYVKFMCYVAIGNLKYGPSFAYVKANEYFKRATDLGSDEVEKLKKHGSGTLPKELTEYKDDGVSCVANDAFATIKITVKKETAESYRRVLQFLNALLPTDFPRSYSIEFSSKEKSYLPIKGLPKKGVHALFANAVRFPELHPLLVEYARLAMKTHEWYNNLNDEECAMPGTFAVLALGLESEAYFGLVQQYMQTVDEEHQSIQTKFTPAFVEKFGITEKSLPVFISCILSSQNHKPDKIFAAQFENRKNLELLQAYRQNFVRKRRFGAANDSKVLTDYMWESVLYTTFGPAKNYPKIISAAPEELQPLYTALLSNEQA